MRRIILADTRSVFSQGGRRLSSTLGFGDSSILGGSTMSTCLVRELQKDIAEERERRASSGGETLRNFIHRSELDHMESPEADLRFKNKVDSMIENVFAKVPLPDDPMAAALQLTPEEEQQQEDFEVLKEAVREEYRRKQQMKRSEESRISAAMERRFSTSQAGSARAASSPPPPRTAAARRAEASSHRKHVAAASPAASCEGDDDDDDDLARQLQALRKQMESLERKLGARKKSKNEQSTS